MIWTTVLIISYLYFTAWVMVTPYVDEDHVFQTYFPERKWAFIVPVYVGCVFLSFVLTYIGLALVHEKNGEAKIENYKK